MNDNFVPYLCGGIFFSFLIELHNNTAREFNTTFGSKKTINQPKIMENLLRATDPEYGGYDNPATFKKKVSEYRTCKNSGDKIIPLEGEYIRNKFDNSVRTQYREVMDRMREFTNKSFPSCNNRSAMCLLIRNTLTLICNDTSIENDTPFFINEDGTSISKKEIFEKEDFNFQSFLVGIWHYIITKPTINEKGKQTFEKLFPKHNKKVRSLDTSCLKPYEHNINITEKEISKESSSKKIYEQEDAAETIETEKNEELSVKIYYKGSLLRDEDENAILSNSPAIVDLNEYPDTPIENNPGSTIYKITTAFQIKTHFPSPREEIVRLYCNISNLSISGTTSVERWISRSKLNEMRFRQKYSCTAWFTLVSCSENEYSAEFLIIGGMLQ